MSRDCRLTNVRKCNITLTIYTRERYGRTMTEIIQFLGSVAIFVLGVASCVLAWRVYQLRVAVEKLAAEIDRLKGPADMQFGYFITGPRAGNFDNVIDATKLDIKR